MSRPLDRQALVRMRDRERRRRKARIRRNRFFAATVASVFGIVAFTAVNVATGSSKPAGKHVLASVTLTPLIKAHLTIPGAMPVLPWPAKGQSAVAVATYGLMAQSPREHIVPIASLTKMMTAYLVLQDHPIAAGSEGPTLTMTQADYAAWVFASQNDESNAPVKVGERLTEYQLLEALLMPSADNVADRLAVWDSGTIAKFLVKMNAMAKELGLSHTHYADASGVNPLSRSTAADQAVLAAALMQNPIVQQIAAQPSVAFPVAGSIRNVNPALGHDGIIGVKSGYTSHAQGCLATAKFVIVGGKKTLVVAVTLTQPDGLYGAADVDEGLLAKTQTTLIAFRPIPAGSAVAQAVVPWSTGITVANLNRNFTVVGWPGMVIDEAVVGIPALPVIASSGRVGAVQFSFHNAVLGSARLFAATPLPAVPDGWQPS